ncbi:MAG: Hsp70 family protein [Acidimicrobiia bacterium]
MSVDDPWVLGIDFGTSFTVAAARSRRGPEVIEVGGERRVPSVVLAEDDGSVVVGRSAEDLATARPGHAIRAPKSRLAEPAPVILGGRPHQVTTLIASLLSYVYREAVRQQGSEPVEVRLTHPAAWSQPRLDRLLTAAAQARLPNPVLVPEPVAAAVSFADEGGVVDGGFVAVYDLGGGTFDTAVLQATSDGFVVVGRPAGEDRLGGDLFDELLANHVGAKLDPGTWEALQVSDERAWQQAAAALRSEARRVKEALSSHPYAELLLGLPTGMVTQRVTRDEFEQLVAPYVKSSVDLLSRAVGDAGLDLQHLDAVYLAGGASRSPVVERLVSEAFPGVTVSRRGDPKTAVALGATHGKAVSSAVRSRISMPPAEAAAPAPPMAPPPGSNPPASNPPASNPPGFPPVVAPAAFAPPSNPPGGPAYPPGFETPPPGSYPPVAPGSYPPAAAPGAQPPAPGSYPPAAPPTFGPGAAAYGQPGAPAGPASYGPAAPQGFTSPAPGYAPQPFSGPAAPTGQYGAGQYGTDQYGGGQAGVPPYGGQQPPSIGGPQPPSGGGKGRLVGLLLGVLAVVLLAGVGGAVLLGGGDGDERADDGTTTSRRRTTTTEKVEDPVTPTGSSIFPPTQPLDPTSSLPTVTTPTVLTGVPTAEQIAGARLALGEVGPSFVEAAYGADEPYCGQPVVITSSLRSNVAYEDATNLVRVDNDVQSYADAGTAAADLNSLRSLVTGCPLTSTTFQGADYFIAVLPFDTGFTLCDETYVLLQVATSISTTAPTISRAIAGVRCGRNLTVVGYSVVNRDFSTADEQAFGVLVQTAANKLSALPR